MREEAIIVDIDGTMAIRGDREPFEWDRVFEDTPNMAVIRTVRALHRCEGLQVIYCSGRMEHARQGTQEWLVQHTDFPYAALFMRVNEDYRNDAVVKREIYDNLIEPIYDIKVVLDDRDKVIKVWREDLGLPCFQVNYGNF